MSLMPIAAWKPIGGKGQNVSIGASSTQSTAFGSQTRAVILSATGTCHIAQGQNPTATSSDMLINAGTGPIVIGVETGGKIAVIQDGSSTGNLNIVEATY